MANPYEPRSKTRLQVRKFNSGLLQTDEEAIEQFSARQHEFRTICEIVEDNIATPSCQHVLVIGARGQGKSMLLRRVAAEVRMNRKFSPHFVAVQLIGTNHEIDSLSDLWMETLYQLARELVSEDFDLSTELEATHRSLAPRWKEQQFEEFARSAVLQASNRIGRRIVLLVEDVQAIISENRDYSGWGLRKTLQSEPAITFIASATHHFDALSDPREPFFEFFRYVYLNPLNVNE